MFTGLIEECGTVGALERVGDGGARLSVDCSRVVDGAAVGDSIAVNGVCLTVARLTPRGFECDLMSATLEVTTLGGVVPGSPVNLERAMPGTGRFGGHIVQGHVDAVGHVVGRTGGQGTTSFAIGAPRAVAPYLVPKGSVTVDGVSLTVVEVEDRDDGSAVFRVGLIPHTLQITTFGRLATGDRVNLEADVIAKYVQRMLTAGVSTPYDDPEVTG